MLANNIIELDILVTKNSSTHEAQHGSIPLAAPANASVAEHLVSDLDSHIQDKHASRNSMPNSISMETIWAECEYTARMMIDDTVSSLQQRDDFRCTQDAKHSIQYMMTSAVLFLELSQQPNLIGNVQNATKLCEFITNRGAKASKTTAFMSSSISMLLKAFVKAQDQ
jgi:hypothetical protein